MEHLWAPWRMEYILNADKGDGCIFCGKKDEDCSEENLIIYKGKLSFVVMNKFPYNSYHIMVMPYAHKDSLEELTDEERLDLMNNLAFSTEKLKKLVSPEGFNIGMNLGRSGGAGVLGHLHFHVVPRWNGDTNYMTVLGEVRVVPQHLLKTYKNLYRTFND